MNSLQMAQWSHWYAASYCQLVMQRWLVQGPLLSLDVMCFVFTCFRHVIVNSLIILGINLQLADVWSELGWDEVGGQILIFT